MKKSLSWLVAIVFCTMIFSGCGATIGEAKTSSDEKVSEGKATFKFEKEIEIICPWGVGSESDLILRRFVANLEKEVGVTVAVKNVAGDNGIKGVELATGKPGDGYTYFLCTSTSLLAQVNKLTDFDVYEKADPIVQLAKGCNVLVAGQTAPYNNYKELTEYMSQNPEKLKVGVMSKTSLEGACAIAAFGDKIELAGYAKMAQLAADSIGNSVPLAVMSYNEALSMVKSGKLKIIMTFAEEKFDAEQVKDVECAKELKLDATYGQSYGIFSAKGVPEEILTAFQEAAKKAVASDDFQGFIKEKGFDAHTAWKDKAAYKTAWDADYNGLVTLFN